MDRHPARSNRTRLMTVLLLTSVVFSGVLFDASPSEAAWQGSAAEDAVAKAVDAILIRPLSLVRVFVGAALMIPSSIFAAPSGLEGLQANYDVLLDAPMEFAFKRELGDF